jgi:hypothetical protein
MIYFALQLISFLLSLLIFFDITGLEILFRNLLTIWCRFEFNGQLSDHFFSPSFQYVQNDIKLKCVATLFHVNRASTRTKKNNKKPIIFNSVYIFLLFFADSAILSASFDLCKFFFFFFFIVVLRLFTAEEM